MLYPLFEWHGVGNGMLMAIIATYHILPCHLATGAFWITYVMERKAYQENDLAMLEFVKKYSLLVLIFCFVTGSLTGAGIWYAATLISPRAISGLIHSYVWGWATEWVFFLIEIVTIYTYYYTFGKISRKAHLRIGLIYAMSAWLSMVIITGILGFMLTPGKWAQTGGFFDGFFNPSYWPQLFVRTAFMFVVGGSYAAIVASFLKDPEVKSKAMKVAAKWGIGGLVVGGLFAIWYFAKIPATARTIIFEDLGFTRTLFKVAIASGVLLFIYFGVWGFMKSKTAGPIPAIIAMLILFVGICAGETMREMARRPYLIPTYMYSNQMIARDMKPKGVKSEVAKFNKEGVLKNYYFAPDSVKEIDASNFMDAGRILTKLECISCHTVESTGFFSIPKLMVRFGAKSPEEVYDFLDALDDYNYMPPFVGTEKEKRAVAAYIASLVNPNGKADPAWVLGK